MTGVFLSVLVHGRLGYWDEIFFFVFVSMLLAAVGMSWYIFQDDEEE